VKSTLYTPAGGRSKAFGTPRLGNMARFPEAANSIYTTESQKWSQIPNNALTGRLCVRSRD
jgi:hypothetical protein